MCSEGFCLQHYLCSCGPGALPFLHLRNLIRDCEKLPNCLKRHEKQQEIRIMIASVSVIDTSNFCKDYYCAQRNLAVAGVCTCEFDKWK
jgi:hypothetical protein